MKSTTVLIFAGVAVLVAAISPISQAMPAQDAATVHNSFVARNTIRDAVDLILGYQNPNASDLAKSIAAMSKQCQTSDQYKSGGHYARIDGVDCPLQYDSASPDAAHTDKTFEIKDQSLAKKLSIESSREIITLSSQNVSATIIQENGTDHITVDTVAKQRIELATQILAKYLVSGNGGSRHETIQQVTDVEKLNFNGYRYNGSLKIFSENRGYGNSHEICSFETSTDCKFLAYLFDWDNEFNPIP